MLLDRKRQDELADKIRQQMQEWWNRLPQERGPISHYCLWWADHTVKVLNAAGLPAQIQAGSAFWRCRRPEEDDGVMNFNWGFQFEWDAKCQAEVRAGLLPEMHVWAAITPPGGEPEIVDVTAKFFKERALADGYLWTMPDPPDYLWTSIRDFPGDRCYYIPNEQAIALSYAILRASETKGPLVVPIIRR